ncbi:MAG: MBL fold metallo-hydrolase [Alphaproteobacteria bacterium]|nr:MBL fold metallo-hydrolase [Alphaproteobacteria bacterium]
MKRCSFEWIVCGTCHHPAYMTNRKASLCPVDFPSFVGIIRHPSAGIILFDTGYDAAFFKATNRFPEKLYRLATPVSLGENIVDALAARAIKPDDVTAVILSHFHGDHVAGLHCFPNAAIYCSHAGLHHLQGKSRFTLSRQGMLTALVPTDIHARAKFFESAPAIALPTAYAPFDRATDLLGDGSLLAVELPGHCPGHWGLALRQENDRHLFLIGDAVWSMGAIEQLIPPPRITTAWLGNTKRYRQTLSALNDCHRTNPDLLMLPSHCPQAAQRREGNSE